MSLINTIPLTILLIIDFLIVTNHFGMVDKFAALLFVFLAIVIFWYIIDLKYE